MRLLFLSPTLPSPPTSGGTARTHGLISNLAKLHEVAVLAFTLPGEDIKRRRAATLEYASEVVTVENARLSLWPGRKRMRQLRSLPSRHSSERLTHRDARFQAELDRLAARWRPDAIVIEFAQMGYFGFPAGVPVVLDAHNVEHEILKRSARVEGTLARLLYSRVNAAKVRREERKLAQRVDGVAVTSERDRELFRRLTPETCPVVVPNGVDRGHFQPSGIEPSSPSLLFFGALDYFPNVDAILSFHRDIWPRLRNRHPELELNIVGRQPPAAVRALAADPRIAVTGVVDDVRPWIERASAVVVPLRAGSGTRLKVLEALAMGRPVVSTSVGVEGLGVEHGTHLLVADAPAQFACAVGRILDEPELGRELGLAGRRLVEERYDWRAISAGFVAFIEDIVERRRT